MWKSKKLSVRLFKKKWMLQPCMVTEKSVLMLIPSIITFSDYFKVQLLTWFYLFYVLVTRKCITVFKLLTQLMGFADKLQNYIWGDWLLRFVITFYGVCDYQLWQQPWLDGRCVVSTVWQPCTQSNF